MKTTISFRPYLAHFFLECKMFQTKAVEKVKIHILFSLTFFFPGNPAGYEIMWKNIVKRGRPKIATWRVRIPCWISKSANTNLQRTVLIACPLQQWLHERASLLRYMYIVTLYVHGLSCSV